MKRDYIEFQERSVALAFLITFRCYGTWLHGDERGSVSRRGSNIFGTPKIEPSGTLKELDSKNQAAPPKRLGRIERRIVEKAIRKVCEVRGYKLYAINVRTNHVHIVVSNGGKVERMMDSFKAYSTKALREGNRVSGNIRPWSRHGSTRYLWTDEHIASAVEYVVNGQGGDLPLFD